MTLERGISASISIAGLKRSGFSMLWALTASLRPATNASKPPGLTESPAALRCPPHSPIRCLTAKSAPRSEEHTSELQSRQYLVCRLLLEKKTKNSTHDK